MFVGLCLIRRRRGIRCSPQTHLSNPSSNSYLWLKCNIMNPSNTLYAFDVSFITGEKGRSFRWVVSGRQGKLASAPVYRCLRFLGLKGAHCFLRRRSCKHSLICEVVEELLHGVGETVHPAPKVVKRRTIWSTAALIFGPSCTLGRAGFS